MAAILEKILHVVSSVNLTLQNIKGNRIVLALPLARR